jgi:hypothetical protein
MNSVTRHHVLILALKQFQFCLDFILLRNELDVALANQEMYMIIDVINF